MNELEIKTFNKNEFVDITDKVEEYLEEKGYKDGILYLNVLHTTAALTINENVDLQTPSSYTYQYFQD